MNRRDLLRSAILAVPAGLVGRAFASASIANAVIDYAELPQYADWNFYEIDGQVVFPIYASNGGIACRSICWLIRCAAGNKWEAIPIEFNLLEQKALNDKSPEALRRLVNLKIQKGLALGKAREFNPEGGSLPMPQECI